MKYYLTFVFSFNIILMITLFHVVIIFMILYYTIITHLIELYNKILPKGVAR